MKQIVKQKRTRPQTLKGKTYKVKTGCKNLYITINVDENGVPLPERVEELYIK